MVNRWRVISAAVVIFIAGAAVGGIVVRTYAPKVVKRMHVSPPLPISHDRREEYISKLDKQVQLTAEQRVQVEEILAASQKRMKAIWEPVEPQCKEEYRRTRREISQVLTPEQQAKLELWRKENKERNKEPKANSPDEKQKACVKTPWDCI